MSMDAARWAWQRPVTPTEKLVLLALAHHVHGRSPRATCYPSLARLRAMTGLSRSSVCRLLDGLASDEPERRALIRRQTRGGRRSTVYELLLGEAADTGPTAGPQESPGGTTGSPTARPQWSHAGTPVVPLEARSGPSMGPETVVTVMEREDGNRRTPTDPNAVDDLTRHPDVRAPHGTGATEDAALPDFLRYPVGAGGDHHHG